MAKLRKPTVLVLKLRKRPVTMVSGTNFLSKLANYNLKNGPRNFAKNHDKYTWE